jgi:hypothetical protein
MRRQLGNLESFMGLNERFGDLALTESRVIIREGCRTLPVQRVVTVELCLIDSQRYFADHFARRSKYGRAPTVARPRAMAWPNAEAEEAMARGSSSEPAADSRLLLRGTAMGPVGTSRVSAVWRFAPSRETRCLGAFFAGSRVKGTAAFFSSWIRTSRSGRGKE